MSLRVLSKVSDALNDTVLGTVVIGMVEDGELTPAEFGAFVRNSFERGDADFGCQTVDASPRQSNLADPFTTQGPIPQLTPQEAVGAIYGSFNDYGRRSLDALSRITGLTRNAVLDLISENTDFQVSTGRISGETFVSIRGLG